MEKLFIHAFESLKQKYIYDFNTNAILLVDDKVYDAIKTGFISDESLDDDTRKLIDDLKGQGFLKTSHWENIQHPVTKYYRQYLNGSIKSVTLQVTQQCNLRCAYCPYSGSYYNREHNNKKMTYEMATKAIDFYIKHSYDLPQLNIGFYGGEPLLEFGLIKNLISYIEKKAFGKKVIYHMTTNGTLLSEEIISYLESKNFMLTISLDGPKEFHDRNRLIQGKRGSFDIVINNIEQIHNNHPDYAKKVSFNCVIDPKNDLKYLNDFFTKNPILNNHLVFFSKIAKEGIKDQDLYFEDDHFRQEYAFEQFKLLYGKAFKSEVVVSHIVSSYYTHLKRDIFERGIINMSENASHPGGPCIAGCHRLFVDIYGNFYPCEKVSESSDDMKIGELQTGIDYEKAERLLNIAKITEEQCKSCWSARFCSVCARHTDTGKGISKEKKLSSCPPIREEIEEILRDYCLIREVHGFNENVIYLSDVD